MSRESIGNARFFTGPILETLLPHVRPSHLVPLHLRCPAFLKPELFPRYDRHPPVPGTRWFLVDLNNPPIGRSKVESVKAVSVSSVEGTCYEPQVGALEQEAFQKCQHWFDYFVWQCIIDSQPT